MANRPKIVCLCGSSRFKEAFMDANRTETLAGKIVLSIGLFGHHEGLDMNGPTKAMLDRLHLAKIDLADEVLFLNIGGYVGESTRRELEYCWRRRKPVRWLEPETAIEEPACDRCDGRRTIQALGCGGDPETWSCPVCRPEEYERQRRGY